MKKKTLAWAIKYANGHISHQTSLTKKDCLRHYYPLTVGEKIIRVEIKEVRRKK